MRIVPIHKLVKRISTWDPRKESSSKSFKYIDLSSIDKEKKIIDQEQVVSIEPGKAPSRARQLIELDDVLVATVRPNLNGVALVDDIQYSGATASTGYCVLRPNKELLEPKYLYFWVRTNHFINEMVKLSTGANYPAISDRTVKSSNIPLPFLEEQKRIAAILDKADAIRRKRQQAIDLTDQLLRSVFLELFGDPVTNPKGWRRIALQDVVSAVIDCPHSTPRWTEEGKVAIRTSNLTVGGWDWADKRYVSEEEYHDRSKRSYVEPGDIILSREGTVGVAAIVQEGMEICLGQRLVQLKPNLEIANILSRE